MDEDKIKKEFLEFKHMMFRGADIEFTALYNSRNNKRRSKKDRRLTNDRRVR